MAKPIFKTWETEEIRVVSFEIPGGVTTPEEFVATTAENRELFVGGEKGVVIDGRGPIWAYAMIVHLAHPSTFVATRDPRLGAVVVETHTPKVKLGECLPFPNASDQEPR